MWDKVGIIVCFCALSVVAPVVLNFGGPGADGDDGAGGLPDVLPPGPGAAIDEMIDELRDHVDGLADEISLLRDMVTGGGDGGEGPPGDGGDGGDGGGEDLDGDGVPDFDGGARELPRVKEAMKKFAARRLANKLLNRLQRRGNPAGK